ncbi:MAG TPA: hypothetical protein VHN80_01060, partial [Kineosporiaceae bacterium]|nr:hypothetical protein [Kineosporiaceae bacterium]
MDAEFLGGDDAFAQILVAGQQEGGDDGAFTREHAQVPVDEGVDALLTAAADAAQPQLDVRQRGDRQLLGGGDAVHGTVVPIDPQQGQPARLLGPVGDSLDQGGVVDQDVAALGACCQM